MSQEAKSGDNIPCHAGRETLLLGLCLLRSGVLEAQIYDATVAHIECQSKHPLPIPRRLSAFQQAVQWSWVRKFLGFVLGYMAAA